MKLSYSQQQRISLLQLKIDMLSEELSHIDKLLEQLKAEDHTVDITFKLQNSSFSKVTKHQIGKQIIAEDFTDYSAQIRQEIRKVLSDQNIAISYSTRCMEPAAVRVLSTVKQIKRRERNMLAGELDTLLDQAILITEYPLAIAV